MHLLTALLSGLLFALGLGVAGMTQPQKVIGFLDIAGAWDPSLAFVMVGAIAVYALGLPFVTRRRGPLFAAKFELPSRRDITPRLVVGAGLFGAGWGLAGYCPGPALTTLVTSTPKIFVFVGAMLAGMVLFRFVDAALTARNAARPSTQPPTTQAARS